MPKMWKGAYGTKVNQNGPVTSLTYVASGVAAAQGEIAVYVGTGVSLKRGAEIVNGLQWLYNGLAERNLLDGAAWTGSIFTGANINNRTTLNRRTHGTLDMSTVFTENDIIIGMGQFPESKGDTVMLKEAFNSVIGFLQEHTLKKV
jgi:hypothetical protein